MLRTLRGNVRPSDNTLWPGEEKKQKKTRSASLGRLCNLELLSSPPPNGTGVMSLLKLAGMM